MVMIEDILIGRHEECLDALDIYENANSLILSKIVVKEECRGQGVGSKVMSELIEYADKNNQIIALTPSKDFGSSVNKLIQFYKKFGFKMNKGANKNFEFRDTMLRYPTQKGQKRVNEEKNTIVNKLIEFELTKTEEVDILSLFSLNPNNSKQLLSLSNSKS